MVGRCVVRDFHANSNSQWNWLNKGRCVKDDAERWVVELRQRRCYRCERVNLKYLPRRSECQQPSSWEEGKAEEVGAAQIANGLNVGQCCVGKYQLAARPCSIQITRCVKSNVPRRDNSTQRQQLGCHASGGIYLEYKVLVVGVRPRTK